MMTNKEIDELYDALEEFHQPEKEISSKSSLEERIIAGFDEINSFYEENNRPPFFGEDRDIFEKEYALRLNAIRQDKDMCSLLKDYDKYVLLKECIENNDDINVDEDTLLNELKDFSSTQDDITSLVYVKPRAEIKAAEEVAQRIYCNDFYRFKDIFTKAQNDLNSGLKITTPFKDNAKIQLGELFILNGQKAYVAEIGQDFKNSNGVFDARLRIIFDNKTESSMLRRSFQRALNKDETSRRITNAPAFPLFSDEQASDDISTGVIYVLRSNSNDPKIKDNREIIHKIGVTGGDIRKRIANAKEDPTFLMADVEVVALYELSNINRIKLENLLHKFFEPARLDINIKDRFGKSIVPREWFLVPLFVIDEAVNKIKDGTIVNFYYDIKSGKIVERT